MRCIVQVLIFGWLAGSANGFDLFRRPGSVKPTPGAGNDEVEKDSVQAGGMPRMELADLMKLVLVMNVDDSNVNAALVKAISKSVDTMPSSELLAAARAFGVGRRELDLTADVEDSRAAVIELIAKAAQHLPDGISGDQGEDIVGDGREPERSDTIEAVVISDGRIVPADSNAELHLEHPDRPPSLLNNLQEEDSFAGGRRRRRRKDSRRRGKDRRGQGFLSSGFRMEACKRVEKCCRVLGTDLDDCSTASDFRCIDPNKGAGEACKENPKVAQCFAGVDVSSVNPLLCGSEHVCSHWKKGRCGSNLMERMNRSSNRGEEEKALNELSRTALDHSLASKCT